jgi:hypothetical protein
VPNGTCFTETQLTQCASRALTMPRKAPKLKGIAPSYNIGGSLSL